MKFITGDSQHLTNLFLVRTDYLYVCVHFSYLWKATLVENGIWNKIQAPITNCMEQSPSWESDRSSASQEVLHISWNPEVHCRIHECPPPFPILSQINLVNASPSHFFKIHFSINISFMPRSSKWSLFLGCPHQNAVWTSPVPLTCHMPRPSYSSWLGLPEW